MKKQIASKKLPRPIKAVVAKVVPASPVVLNSTQSQNAAEKNLKKAVDNEIWMSITVRFIGTNLFVDSVTSRFPDDKFAEALELIGKNFRENYLNK